MCFYIEYSHGMGGTKHRLKLKIYVNYLLFVPLLIYVIIMRIFKGCIFRIMCVFDDFCFNIFLTKGVIYG